MDQYSNYWEELKDRIEQTEYTHLTKIYNILTDEEMTLITGLTYGYNHVRWSKLRVVWKKKKANWFRMSSNTDYDPDDTDKDVGMRRTTMHT